MEGTIGTPPLKKTHFRDSAQTCGSSSPVGQKLAQSLPRTEPCMEARTPGLHMILGRSLPSTEPCIEARTPGLHVSLGQHTPNLGPVLQETSPGLMAQVARNSEEGHLS